MFHLSKSIEILEQTPKTLHNLLHKLSDDWVFATEGKDTWSAYDIVGHLIHGENTDWIPRLNIILSDLQDKTFEPYNRFAQFENSKGKTLLELLNEFQQLRHKNLNYLKSLNLSEQQLHLQGMHPELGPVTLKQLIAAWVVHDLSHIHQISRVMSKQYSNEVGSWIDYMGVLHS